MGGTGDLPVSAVQISQSIHMQALILVDMNE